MPSDLQAEGFVILRECLGKKLGDSTVQMLACRTRDRVIRLGPNQLVPEFEIPAHFAKIAFVEESR